MMKGKSKCYYKYQALCEWRSADFKEVVSTR